MVHRGKSGSLNGQTAVILRLQSFSLGKRRAPKVGTLARILKNIAARHQMTVEELLQKLELYSPGGHFFSPATPGPFPSGRTFQD